MNKLERTIHHSLSQFPKLKNIARFCYQSIFRLTPANNFSVNEITIREGYFFGFHDRRPWSSNDKYLLSHKLYNKSLNANKLTQPVQVGYFYGDNYQQFEPVSMTSSWNYQQGSMLQWLGNTEQLVFNDFNGRTNIARVNDINGSQVNELPLPVCCTSPDGSKALSYSFERYRTGMPGYEYQYGYRKDENKPAPGSDGLYLLDTGSGQVELIFSIQDIVNCKPTADFDNAFHYFSHGLFSPRGNRIVFFHRWVKRNRASSTRMISCELDGSNMHIFPTGKLVSHIGWYDNDHVIAYADTKTYGDNYYLFSDTNDDFTLISGEYFNCDGHPQVSPDGRWMVTDTYPDRNRNQSLLIYDFEQHKSYKIAQFRIPLKYRNELRCDFHPRWNSQSNMISFDSAQTGYRAHCTTRFSLP